MHRKTTRLMKPKAEYKDEQNSLGLTIIDKLASFALNSVDENTVLLAVLANVLSFNLNVRHDKQEQIHYVCSQIISQMSRTLKQLDSTIEESLRNKEDGLAFSIVVKCLQMQLKHNVGIDFLESECLFQNIPTYNPVTQTHNDFDQVMQQCASVFFRKQRVCQAVAVMAMFVHSSLLPQLRAQFVARQMEMGYMLACLEDHQLQTAF
jgi:hypothetical protein